MALSIKGSPQPIKAVGSLKQITRDPVAASAVRDTEDKKKREAHLKRRGMGDGKA